ncbi:hypothetical protein JYU17_00835, partial [Flavobacteriaceae bacterium AH-315-O20]|nr:hypothetical protein [Flavobacteriaceae bacterium AH-315-O20]
MRSKTFSKEILIILCLLLFSCNTYKSDKLIFVCSEDNDLYNAIIDSKEKYSRFSSANEAINAAKDGAGILVLADNYPKEKVNLSDKFFEKAKSKNIKLYIEYPSNLPNLKIGKIQKIKSERGVVTSGVFGNSLEKMRIVMMHDCHYVQVEAENPHLVVAKVAGFDKAIYGLDSTKTNPILFEEPNGNILVSTTKLSQFITGRYAPKDAWKPIWNFVFKWLQPNEVVPELNWTEAVHPAYSKTEKITQKNRLQAIQSGVDWFYNSNLMHIVLEDDRSQRQVIDTEISEGDYGKNGIYECFLSKINYDGSQQISKSKRADCASESAMAIAMRNFITPNVLDKTTATNLQDFVYFNSQLQQGSRNDVKNPSYGFIDWYINKEENKGIYYGDDNARVILATLTSAAALKNNRWDNGVLKAILANLRATSSTGFKPNRLKEINLNELGWEHYRDEKEFYQLSPHYQSWIMSTYLWLYDKTNYEPLLLTAKAGIKNLMNAYPNEWHWTNGLQQERARMILPLAWLVRVDDTVVHRKWLKLMVDDLLSFQDESGAIKEDLGDTGYGKYAPPKSNAEYGTNEAPLIQENDDPIADMLYTSNFAFFTLTEAAAVT